MIGAAYDTFELFASTGERFGLALEHPSIIEGVTIPVLMRVTLIERQT
jgi:hypothetical protein